ncbi:hypothetical protein ABH930_005261 [Kitasatospora sp. GAS204A]|uniref:hypothetical protein n=1 Tax=unclassified Kitasatospora TaxID=2633591 RepID=UPI002476FF1C|nr:hypothetical protein [Kitasatospora sp. GAS204B]MDH6117882.1 hypothetical protein [Kitasatospora sp. GAS204B]
MNGALDAHEGTLDQDGRTLRSAFLAALGVDVDPAQEEILRRELEVLSHPRARVAAARQEPQDTLVQFLATTLLAVPEDAVQAFRARLAQATDPQAAPGPEPDRSPRDALLSCVTRLFGHPAQALAAQLDLLITECGHDGRALDSWTVRRLYAEAGDLCDVWALALADHLCEGFSRTSTSDEVFATEVAVLGRFDPSDAGERRIDMADLVRQLTELVALDQWRLLPRDHWPNAQLPSLGWPAVLVQAQYRLRQLAAAGPSATVAEGTGDAPPVPVERIDRRHGQARHLLAAYGADERYGLTFDQPSIGHQRIRRSHHEPMPQATAVQLADLAWALRRQPELMRVYGLGPPDAANETAAALTVLLRCRQAGVHRQGADLPAWWTEPVPGPGQLPLDSWELREHFPELRRLLALYRDLMTRGAVGGYWETHDPATLVHLVSVAYLDSCGASGRVAAELSAEIASLCLLFTGDEQVDRAVALLGEQPRESPAVPWWDDLTWHAWLREVGADVMWHARH